MYAVITENDESRWDDMTGKLYHFPKRYQKYLETGTRFVYYKGKLRDVKYRSSRLADKPHYFGEGVIGEVYPDAESSKGDLYAVIEEYKTYSQAVLAKMELGYFEIIPDNMKSNYWRNGVRSIGHAVYDKISNVAIKSPALIDISVGSDASKIELDDKDISLESYEEGEKKQVYSTKYERDSRLRAMAIAIHGTQCAACGFDFSATYGEHGEGYIQIHHIKPLYKGDGAKQKVNPQTDLIPLCANCHVIIHRRKDKTLYVEELKVILNSGV